MNETDRRLVCSDGKRAAIRATRRGTALRRAQQVVRVCECKIVEKRLNSRQREELKMLFVEGKWHKRGQKTAMLLPIGILALGLVMLFIALQYKFPYLAMVGLTLIGFTYGCMPSICATFVADKFGSTYYAANLSLINLTMLLSSFSSVISGTLYAKSGSFLTVLILYSISWGIMLALYVVGKNMYNS